jgi:arginyl-tRNA--protein-N-Asp/Glu arginylyltransferase
MNRLLKECALDESCAYLPDRKQTTHYKIIDECSDTYCETLIERGWRRFGNMFFRPVCSGCEACESVKIDAENYRFSKSARRVIRKNSHLRTVMQRPTLTQAHLELFRDYHDHMEIRRGWDNQPVNARNYHLSFVQGHNDFGYEILYFDEEKLVAVDLIDLLPNGISSIYFYYHPDYASHSLGRYSLYRQIMYAQANGLKWIYLGYYVEGCPSLAYKSSYKPYYILEGKPCDADAARWNPNEA